MSNLPENISPFDFAKIQLTGQLTSVADSMRKCAELAEQFSQIVAHIGPINVPMSPMAQYSPAMQTADPKLMPPPVVPLPTNGKRKAQSVPDGGEIKKKKVKKIRDPNAPKRPPSSYLLFQNEVRQAMKQANPGMANHEILTTISQRWASMTPEEKDTYHKRQEVAKAQYTLNKTAYDARHGPAAEDVVSPTAAEPVTSSPAPAPLLPALVKVPVAKAAIVPAPVVEDTSTSDESSEDDDSSETSESSNETEQLVQKHSSKVRKQAKKVLPVSKKETGKKNKN